MRLVGPILIPEHLSLFGREIVTLPRHDRRTLVKRVDHVSGVAFPGGRRRRDELGLQGGGPRFIVTPLCIFAFDEAGEIFVHSVHPGVTAEDVRANTGYAIDVPDGVERTDAPTAQELEILRRDFDPHGLLRA